jgi:hypothetical protein
MPVVNDDLPTWKVIWHAFHVGKPIAKTGMDDVSVPGHDIDPDEAAAALHHVDAGRQHVADRLVTPAWYHPVLGLLAGLRGTA